MQTKQKVFTTVLALVIATLAYRAFFAGRGEQPRNAQQTGKTIIVFGDEQALRLGGDIAGHPAKNFGVAGDTTVSAAARFDAVLSGLGEKPNYVIVALGRADLEQRLPLADTLKSLETVLQKAQDAGAMVVYLPYEPPREVGDNWLMAIRDLCRVRDVLWGGPKLDEALAPYL